MFGCGRKGDFLTKMQSFSRLAPWCFDAVALAVPSFGLYVGASESDVCRGRVWLPFVPNAALTMGAGSACRLGCGLKGRGLGREDLQCCPCLIKLCKETAVL